MSNKSKRIPYETVRKQMLTDPIVKAEYEKLMEDFDITNELIQARMKSRKTQKEVAELMETTNTVISRMEGGGGKANYSPTLLTLKKYAAAVGCKLEVKLKPIKTGHKRVDNQPGKHKKILKKAGGAYK